MSYIPGTEANRESRAAHGQDPNYGMGGNQSNQGYGQGSSQGYGSQGQQGYGERLPSASCADFGVPDCSRSVCEAYMRALHSAH